MSIKKKLTLITLMVVSVFCLVFGAVACNGSAKQAVEMYLLPQEQTLVSEDFSLPKKIGKDDSVTVEWKSSNTDAISIEDAGDKYTAKVTLQDEVTDVTLTISAGGASKDFVVRVDELTVYTFLDRYEFPQMNTAQKSDFDLDTEMTVQGKKATIAWSVDSQYAEFIAVNKAGNKVIVSSVEDIKSVKIKATFSYGEDTASQDYPFSVAPPLEHRQLVNRMYSVEGYPIEFSGYVVHVYSKSEDYGGNATFYAIDDDFCSGYYIYQAGVSTDQLDKVVEGAHFTFSGDKAKNYSGLWETVGKEAGKAVFDDKAPIVPREHIYALDTDLLAGAPSLLWRESTFVSLSGWKITKKESSKPTTKAANMFTISRDGVSIAIRYATYINRTEDEKNALLDVYDNFEEGDYVNVTGILGCYNTAGGFDVSKFQLQPILASDITKATAEGTNTDGAKVKAAIAKVDAEVQKNFGGIVTTDKEVTMPTSEGDVTISYRVAGENLQDPTVTVNGGKISVKPVTTEKNYDIEVTYSIGDYKAYGFFKIHNWKKSDSELVETVKAALQKLELETVTTAGEVTFPTLEDDYGATITWGLGANAPDWITEEDGKITVTALPDKETTVTVVANITLGEAKGSVKLTLTVAAAPTEVFKALEEPAAGTYKLAMYNGSTKKTYYALGTMANTYYYGTTEDPSQAADFVIEQVGSENKYTIKINGKYLEFAARESGTQGVDIKMNDTQTAGKYWQWNNAIKNFVFESTYNEGDDPAATDTDLYYLGNYSTNTTMSGNYIGRIADKSGDTYTAKENTEGVSQWVAHFGNMVTASAADKLNEAKNALELDTSALKEVGDEVDLPATGLYGATIAWTLPEEDTYLEIANGKLSVKALPEEGSQTITVTATITLGTETPVTKEFTVTLKAPEKPGEGFQPVTAPAAGSDYYIAMQANDTWYYLTGVATSTEYRLAVTTEISQAAKVTLEATTGGWIIKCGTKYLEIVQNGSYVNSLYHDTRTEACVWVWEEVQSTFSVTVGSEKYFLGSYGEYLSNMSANKFSFLTGSSSSAQYPARLGTYAGEVEPDPDPDPEPELSQPTKGTEIVTEGATVFDFAEVEKANDELTDGATLLGMFKNAEQAGLTATTGSKVYAGNTSSDGGPEDYRSAGGFLRMGSSKANGTLTLTFSKDVTKVQILCLGWSATDTIAIDGFEPATIGNTAQVVYTFTLTDAVKSFTITTAKRALIFKIAVTFADGGSVEPEPEPEPGGAEFDKVQTDFPTTAIPQLKAKVPNADDTTEESFYVLGAVKSFDDSDYYCNFYIYDAEGNELYVYGLYKEDGSEMINITTAKTLFDVDDIIVLYGTLKNYKGNVQIVNAWLVQIGNEAKTDEAAVLLAGIELTTPVTEDFTLPTLGGKVSWAVTSGSGITIQDNVAKVTRTEENQTVVLTATANSGNKTATKTFTIVVSLEKAGYEEIVITAATLLPNVSGYEASGNATIAGYPFSWTGMGNYGLLQMRTNSTTGTSSFWNTTAFKENISKVVFTWAAEKTLSTKQNVLKVEFANDVAFTGASSQTITFTTKTFELVVEGDYKFVRITHNDQGAVYLDEVMVVCQAKSTQPAGPTADDGFHFDKGVANLIGTWSSEDGYKIVVTETTFLFTDPEGQKCTYTVTETAAGALYTHSILWQGKTYKLDTPAPNKLVFMDDQTESYTFTKEGGGTVSFPESLRGTYTCVAVESEDEIEAEDVAPLTITESGITWDGEATDFEGNIEQMLSFTINGEQYMAMYQMGMLMIRDSAGNMYTFMNTSGGAGGGVGGLL